MSAYLKELGLNGFSSWTKIQAKEEVEHGLKIFDYLINCNSFITLKQIKTPEFEFQGILSIFEKIYEHEKSITNSIMSVAKKAEEECDRTTLNFIDWFIEEQLDE
jgi:ferritin